MKEDRNELHEAAAAIAAVCNGEEEAWDQVPVPIRAALAAVAPAP